MSSDAARADRKRNKSTKDFWRACRYLGPHRKIVAISIGCAFLVGLTSAGGMGALLPILQLLFNDDTLQTYASRVVVQHRIGATIAETPTEIRVLAVNKGGGGEGGPETQGHHRDRPADGHPRSAVEPRGAANRAARLRPGRDAGGESRAGAVGPRLID